MRFHTMVQPIWRVALFKMQSLLFPPAPDHMFLLLFFLQQLGYSQQTSEWTHRGHWKRREGSKQIQSPCPPYHDPSSLLPSRQHSDSTILIQLQMQHSFFMAFAEQKRQHKTKFTLNTPHYNLRKLLLYYSIIGHFLHVTLFSFITI